MLAATTATLPVTERRQSVSCSQRVYGLSGHKYCWEFTSSAELALCKSVRTMLQVMRMDSWVALMEAAHLLDLEFMLTEEVQHAFL